jgi:OmpA-OmpF porin, OOP family
MPAVRIAAALIVALLAPQSPLPKNPEWLEKTRVVRDTPEAEMIVRTGDIDNFGFGWPNGFDPYSGQSTRPHGYPFKPSADDPDGTDRIMVPSSYVYGSKSSAEGYTRSTKRPDNAPRPIVLQYDLGAIAPKAALLRLFVDDFQIANFKSSFQVTLNGERAPFIERVINALQQTGPIGKLITVELLPEYVRLLSGGKLSIFIDDPTTGVGDGFAIDFVELLINPRQLRNVGTVHGTVTDRRTGRPLAGAVVSAGGAKAVSTDKLGQYSLSNVAAGLVVGTGSMGGYEPGTNAVDLVSAGDALLNIKLEPSKKETSASITEALDVRGRAILYGIHFDSNSAVPRPDSAATLQALLELLRGRPALGLVVEGHTDSQNTEEFNQKLSENRAKSVVDWLVKHGIAAARLRPAGYGESRPLADNGTAVGRALNRRVEVATMTEKK